MDGDYELVINDGVAGNVGTLTDWSITVATTSASGVLSTNPGNRMDQNADGVTGENPVQSPFRG